MSNRVLLMQPPPHSAEGRLIATCVAIRFEEQRRATETAIAAYTEHATQPMLPFSCRDWQPDLFDDVTDPGD